MLTKEALDALLTRAMFIGHERLAFLCKSDRMPLGALLYCKVAWPKAHRDEHYLLPGPQPEAAIDVASISEAGNERVHEPGFLKWWAVQELHEQFVFTLQVQVRVAKYANQAGLVVLPASSLN